MELDCSKEKEADGMESEARETLRSASYCCFV